MIAIGQAQTSETKARTALSSRKLRLASARRTSRVSRLKPGRRRGDIAAVKGISAAAQLKLAIDPRKRTLSAVAKVVAR